MGKKSYSDKKLILTALRYVILLILVLNSYLVYKILTPLTVYFSVIFLKFFYPVIVFGNQMLINQTKLIEVIPSCVAGSAYILLLILNLFVAMKPRQRIYSILLSFGILFVVNILRISVLSVLLVNDSEFFYITHKLSWYVLSTLLVLGIWLLNVKIFKIKEIPILSDIRYFIKNTKKSKIKK